MAGNDPTHREKSRKRVGDEKSGVAPDAALEDGRGFARTVVKNRIFFAHAPTHPKFPVQFVTSRFSERGDGDVRMLSSVGRAAPLQGVGREFETLSIHQLLGFFQVFFEQRLLTKSEEIEIIRLLG